MNERGVAADAADADGAVAVCIAALIWLNGSCWDMKNWYEIIIIIMILVLPFSMMDEAEKVNMRRSYS